MVEKYPEDMAYVAKCREKAKRLRQQADKWENLSKKAIQKCFDIYPDEPLDEKYALESINSSSVGSPVK